MALDRKFSKTAKEFLAVAVRSRTRSVTKVSVAIAAALALAGLALALSFNAKAAPVPTSSPLWGTLDTQTGTAATEDHAGVTLAMFEFNWASFEPSKGVFSAAVRGAALTYFNKIAADFPLTDFWAIRLTSGGDPEMLYPGGGAYWAFNPSALTGKGLPSGMKANPFPSWKPGTAGLTQAQIDRWVNWYVGGLDSVTNGQMQTLSSLGFTGYYETVTPGSGTRPDDLTQTEQQNLSNDGTTGVGAVWDRYYAMLPNKANVIAY